MCLYFRLKRSTVENTQKFTFKNLNCKAKVLSVYDGDTVQLAIPFKGTFFENIFNVKCRLVEINAPEMKGIEKERGIKSRDYLSNLILNKIVTVECGAYEKYGRLLVTIYHNGININKDLVKNGFAKNYFV